jgi:hypothetical protein
VVLSYEEEGKIDRRRLSGILGAATTLLVLLLIVALSLGAIGAAGVGIGGFVVEFSDVTAPSGTVYPALAEQSTCDNAPQLMANLNGQAVIQDHFRVTKGIPLPGGVVDGFSVNIMSEAGNFSNITAQDLELRLAALDARRVMLQNTTLTEHNVEPDEGEEPSPFGSYAIASNPNSTNFSRVSTEFAVNASGGFALRGGRAVVYQIAFGNLDISDIGVSGSLADSENMTMAGSVSNNCDEIFQQRVSIEGRYNTTNATELPDLEGEPLMEVVSVTPPPDATLDAGETLSVEANVSNVGNGTETWTAYMSVENGTDDELVDTQNVTVAPNSSVTVVLEHEVRQRDLPELGASVGVEDPAVVFGGNETDDANETNETEAEPEIGVVDTRPDGALEVGDTFSVDLNVTNVGGATGNWSVYMNVTNATGANTTVASRNVTLAPDESTAVTLDYEATPSDVPTVDATLGVDELG